MKKVLGLGLAGGAILAVFLWIVRGQKEHGGGSGSPASLPAAATTTTPPLTPPSAAGPVPSLAGTIAIDDDAACARLADLCSTSAQAVDSRACRTQLADARKMSGASNVDRSVACLADAKTCAAATGCLSGGIGAGALGEFLKGLGSAISK